MSTSTNPTTGDPFFPLSLVEYRAANNPGHVWARIPASDDNYDGGFTDITYAEFQNAVDGAAHWLKSATGREPGETIAYVGLWDPRYVWMALGASKAGYRIVFPSLLSAPALKTLVLERLGCKAVITAAEPQPHIADFISGNNLQHIHCPPVNYFTREKHEHIPVGKTYDEAADDTLCVMYTSGSTSDSKPVVWTNSFAASFFRQYLREPPKGWESIDRSFQGVDLISVLPAPHCGSLYGCMFAAPLTLTTIIYPLPGLPVHPETFLQLIEHTKADTALMPPAFAEYIAADPARTAKVAQKVSNVAYAGGPISAFAGERLTRAFNLFSVFACTENGVYPTLRPAGDWDPERWRTVRFHPDAGMKLEKIGDGTYEVVIERPPGSSLHDPNLPPALESFPHLDVWRTEDCFAPDPSEPGSYVYSSRISDVIRYTDGTIFNPLRYEQHVQSHPAVSAALLFGSKKPDAVMLLEPASEYNTPEQDRDELINLVWPHIEKANQKTRGECCVSKSRIVITAPGKNMPRAPKGTLQRGKARALYQSELVATL